MIEAAWLCLAVAALRSPEARPFIAVLAFKWLAAYGIVWVSGGSVVGYTATALLDILVLVLLAPTSTYWPWSNALWAGQVAAVSVQAVHWSGYLAGHHYGVGAYYAFQVIFTAQLIASSWPSWGQYSRDFRRCLYRRVRLLGRAHHRGDL